MRSSGSVTGGYDTDYQLPVEQAVAASGLEWTHLRPGEFAANRLAVWGPSIRAERVVRWPDPAEVGPFLLGYEGFSAGTDYPEIAVEELRPLPTVEQVTGRPARSFAQWALDHAGDFR